MSLLDSFLLAMAAPQEGAPSPWLQLIPFALILGIFYFVMVLPMRKRQQKVQAFLAALKWRNLWVDHARERPIRAASGGQ
jgi:type II secretory pathway component PulM